jgi:5-methylcytosine-specific restriction protein B
LNVTFEEKFNSKPENKVLISFEINDWNEIPLTIIENHTKEFLLQYNSIKNTKRATWNTEANTTNSVLKYLLFKGENTEEWINSTKKTRNHHIDFFTALEFEILNKSQGLICDRAKPEVNKYYDILKLAYEKLHYLTEIVQKEVFTKGKFNLLKKPTNQANYFQGYIWSKIYPTSKDNEDKWLAFTIGLDSDFHFNIKIDTVGLGDTDKKRIEYLKKRGDFYKSKIVNRPKSDAFNTWDDLINYCINTIENLESDYYDLKKATALETKTENKENNFPLNQILYGPPGTGKTYTTKELAVNIINADFIKSLDKNLSEVERRKAISSEYTKLFELGQIVFTTFHQSMSYEDFVEGIKPVMRGEEDGGLSYEIQDGIFKAIGNKAQAQESQESQVIVNNFEDSWNKLIELVRSKISTKNLLKIGSWEYGLSTRNSLKYSSLNSPSQYTFTITKQNVYDAYQNKKARPSGAFQKDMLDIVAFMKEELKLNENQILNNLDEKYKQNKQNYVIIIDEINRGNISQIFGELITLIEEDKRIGKEEAVEITLPYSKEIYGVPSNLYIIGTMNTADRSVEALDTALRRRFSFTEVMPNSNLLEAKSVNGIKLKTLLETINNRIAILLNRDHTIGHSYFIKLENDDVDGLRSTFKNNIIPLLQEYFYGDYEKIGMVLGAGFVSLSDKNLVRFPKFIKNNDYNTSRYELIPIDGNFDIINALSQLWE